MRETISEDLREHLLDLKALTQAGQTTPVISGMPLALWGAALTIASVLSARFITYGQSDLVAVLWPVTIGLCWIAIRVLKTRMRNTADRLENTSSNDLTRAVWVFTGAVSSALILLEVYGQIDMAGRAYLPVFMLCGLSFVATGRAADEPLLIISGIGWAVIGIASLFILNSPVLLFLLTALASSVFLAIPGFVIAFRK